MKLYAISGLGADHRVFGFLELDYDLEVIPWIEPEKNESLSSYAIRLSNAMDTSPPFGLIGVSFGGIVVVELNKILKPEFSILVSSAAISNDIPTIYRLVGKIGILKLFPKWFFNPPRPIAYWIFGAQNKQLLTSILDDTDLSFAKWAVLKIVSWQSSFKTPNLVRIHGSQDKLLPLRKHPDTIVIDNGSHFMIVDNAKQVSNAINKNTPQK